MRQRPELRWWIVSIAVHGVVLVMLAWAVGKPGLLPWFTFDQVAPTDTVTIVWADEPREQGTGSRELAVGPAAIGPLPVVGGGRPGAALRDTSFGGIDLDVPERDGVPPVSVTPGFGDGRLWVRPGAVLARGAAGRPGDGVAGVSAPLEVGAHVASLDSVLAIRILAYLDTLPPDSFAYNLRPPSWTTEIDGRTWGIDQNWIYLGDLKLPTILLGLLPFPAQGNYEQGQRNAELRRIREDILRAAARASDAADFRRYVNELRERREAERRQDQDE